MWRSLIMVVVLAVSLPWAGSTSAIRPAVLAGPPSPDRALRDLIPASALLAVEVRDLDRRWGEIRSLPAIANLQDAILSGAGIPPELLPRLFGSRGVVFLASSPHPPNLMPVAILRPPDLQSAESVLGSLQTTALVRAGGAIWLGPAGSEDRLAELAANGNVRLVDVLPFAEIERRLPPAGLISGWVNPAAWAGFLRACEDLTGLAPIRFAASAAAGELETMRYLAFRRDLVNGGLEMDGIAAYEVARLPGEVARIFDPNATPALLPAELPPETVAAAAFRPQAAAWLPWLRYLSAADARGPLRNLDFWIGEFGQRYRRDLDREIFHALGEQAWMLATLAGDNRSVTPAWVFEVRDPQILAPALLDFISWLGEQVSLQSLGAVRPQLLLAGPQGNAAHDLALRLPFFSIPGPRFRIAGGYLVIGANDAAMQAALALAESARREAGATDAAAGPVHGSVRIQGGRLAEWIQAAIPAIPERGGILDAIAVLVRSLDGMRIDLSYEADGFRVRGRIGFAVRR